IVDRLRKEFDIVHLCGKGKVDEELMGKDGYLQYEYIREELPDLFALADIVISRAGANAICELLALKKPNLLIPLSAKASRGDQILNAASFEKQGFSLVLQEEDITDDVLFDTVTKLYQEKDAFAQTMAEHTQKDAITIITELIEEVRLKRDEEEVAEEAEGEEIEEASEEAEAEEVE
ncbi:MAG: hypothetical protein KBS83_07625, partial [Lachnospiraceae bacterium]|nr:hypothetical protein [Candidatus Equihabitans merdae]